MKLIVGLGNPGKKYEGTRHNIGFQVLDLLAGSRSHDEGGWENKYDAQFLKLDDLILAKPQTFMNLSGKAVSQMLKYYPEAELIIIHDELDFPLGTIKVMKNISSAGHNGVQSIIDELGTKDFIRIRLGINNPETKGQIPSEDYVLQKFTEPEQQILKEMIEKAKTAIDLIQTEGLEIAQSRING
jgi:peptidyl-tRNA hydrolase, PTH1 family